MLEKHFFRRWRIFQKIFISSLQTKPVKFLQSKVDFPDNIPIYGTGDNQTASSKFFYIILALKSYLIRIIKFQRWNRWSWPHDTTRGRHPGHGPGIPRSRSRKYRTGTETGTHNRMRDSKSKFAGFETETRTKIWKIRDWDRDSSKYLGPEPGLCIFLTKILQIPAVFRIH